MTRRASDAQITVKPHGTAGVDPATVESDLNFAAAQKWGAGRGAAEETAALIELDAALAALAALEDRANG